MEINRKALPDMDPSVQEKLHGLGDLELAVLLSVIAEQHFIVACTKSSRQDVERELQLVSV